MPSILLAFAYDPISALPEVANELNSLTRILTETGVKVSPFWKATADDISTGLVREQKDLRIFHFSGHAGSNFIELNQADGGAKAAYSDGLAGLFEPVKPIKLVFLNGCSTEAQVQALLQSRVPAVIATTQPLNDQYGVEFARRFYESFTNPNSELTLKEAFDFAMNMFKMQYGKLRPEMMDARVRTRLADDAPQYKGPIYTLHENPNRKGALNERFANWLQDAADEDRELVRQKVRALIGNARIGDALTAMLPMWPDALQLQQDFSSIRKREMMGIVDTDEIRKIQNTISYQMLEMLKD